MSNVMLDKSKAKTFKLVIIGDSSSGKSSLLLKITDGKFIDSHRVTIGVDFKAKYMSVNNTLVRLKIWDTAGQERFRSIIRTYYHGTHGIILVFDLTNEDSFNNLGDWVKEINEIGSEKISVILIGNKSDLQDQIIVSQEEIDDFVKNCGIKMKYFECSSKTGKNVIDAFNHLTNELLNTDFSELEMEKIQIDNSFLDFYASNTLQQSKTEQNNQIDYSYCCNVS